MDDLDFSAFDWDEDEQEIMDIIDELGSDMEVCINILLREETTLKQLRVYMADNKRAMEISKVFSKN